MLKNLRKLRRPCGEGFARPTLSKELLWKLEEEPGPWESLATEVVWNEFSLRFSITTILKAKRYPLSFLHRELDISSFLHHLTTSSVFVKLRIKGRENAPHTKSKSYP